MIGFTKRNVMTLVFKEHYPEIISITLLLLVLASKLFNLGLH